MMTYVGWRLVLLFEGIKFRLSCVRIMILLTVGALVVFAGQKVVCYLFLSLFYFPPSNILERIFHFGVYKWDNDSKRWSVGLSLTLRTLYFVYTPSKLCMLALSAKRRPLIKTLYSAWLLDKGNPRYILLSSVYCLLGDISIVPTLVPLELTALSTIINQAPLSSSSSSILHMLFLILYR